MAPRPLRSTAGARLVVLGASIAALVLALGGCGDRGEDPGPDATTPRGRASRDLLRAAAAGDLAATEAALRAGADVEARGEAERTPLVLATRAGATDVARRLLAAGADPNATDAIHDSAFLYAGAEGLDAILVATIEHGADVTSTNRYGGTALIPAAEHGHVSTVHILIEAGVPVDHVNDLGWTALHEAIVLGDGSDAHVETVRLLVAAGADVSIPDGEGARPVELAADRGYERIVQILRRAGGEP